MVIYNLKEETMEKVIYEYFPEKIGEAGILVYIKNTKELLIEKVAPEDKFKIYANKARSSILSGMQKKGTFPETGMAAWY